MTVMSDNEDQEKRRTFRSARAAATVRPQRQALSPAQALAVAEELQQAGRLPEAERILRDILAAAPDWAPAVHLLGVVAHMAGKTDVAAELVARAIALDGKQAFYHANMGEMCRLLGRLEDAVKYGRKAVKLDPSFVAAHSNLGLAYYDLGDFDKAEYCHGCALRLDPAFAPSLNNMGSIARARHDDEKAEGYFRAAIRANPRFRDPQSNLGEILVRRDKPREALDVLDGALAAAPDDAAAHSNRGLALMALGRVQDAEEAYRQALRCDPRLAPAHAGLVMVALEVNNLAAAADMAARLLELDPQAPDSHALAGAIFLAQGRDDEAEESFRKALALDERHIPAKLGYGHLLMERGDLKGAETFFRAGLGAGGDRLLALCALAQAKKIAPDDPDLALLRQEAKKLEGPMIASKAIQLNFALGKMHDDLKDYDRAFPYFLEGCRLKRTTLEYSVVARDGEIAQLKNLFTKDSMARHAGAGDPSDVPVFVLGMPRSGTTLTEQILSSHPDVCGAGELRDLADCIGASPGSAGFAEKIKTLDAAALAEMGRKYAAGLAARGRGARRVTDKMPGNFHYIGLIKLMLPNAKIIHVTRDPVDTCLSCFTRLFAHGQNFSYDLAELGHYYRTYRDLMAHWRALLPPDAFYDLRYEDLVDDTETEAKKLLAYCGLPWNDACLDFHKNDRPVRTASVMQVRQPIYKSSKQRWKNYESHLAPLIAALDDAPAPHAQ